MFGIFFVCNVRTRKGNNRASNWTFIDRNLISRNFKGAKIVKQNFVIKRMVTCRYSNKEIHFAYFTKYIISKYYTLREKTLKEKVSVLLNFV